MQISHAKLKPLARILVLFSTVLVAACAPPPTAMPPNALTRIKTVGVVSLIGDSLNYEQIAITAFSNDLFKRPAAEFGIDPYVIGLITKQLAGRFDVRPVHYNPADFESTKITLSDDPTLFDSGDPVGKVIQAKATPNNLDAYIVVAKVASGVKNTNQTASGLGLTRRAMAFYHLYWAHALYWVGIVDGHTGKLLAGNGAPGGQQELGLFEVPAVAGPYKDVDETYWPADTQNISPAEAKLLADKMKELIAASLPDTLNRTLSTQ